MRMVMGIDEPGDYQPSRRVDDFIHAVAWQVGAHRNDLVVFDQDIGDRRLMDIPIMVVDLAALNQRSSCCHKLRSSDSSGRVFDRYSRIRAILVELISLRGRHRSPPPD